MASATGGGTVGLRLGSRSGTVVGRCSVPNTGGWQAWTTVSCPVSGVRGTHDLCLRFTDSSGYLLNVDWWRFTRAAVTAPR